MKETLEVDVKMNFNNVHPIMRGMHVTDLLTGFSGLVVQERHYLHAPSRMCVAPIPHVGRHVEKERYIDVRRLRVDKPIRRKNGPASAAVRYALDAQPEIVEALFDFAANVKRPSNVGNFAQRPQDDSAVNLAHVQTALDQIIAGLGYVKAGE